MSVPSSPPLTRRQRQIWLYLWLFQEQHGYPPTAYEIAKAFGWKSPSGANVHMYDMCAKGYVLHEPNEARSWVPIRPGAVLVMPSWDGTDRAYVLTETEAEKVQAKIQQLLKETRHAATAD